MTLPIDTQRVELCFWTPGIPQTAGSKASGVSHRFDKATGRYEPVRRANGKLMTFTKESGDKDAKAAWRADVREAARRAIADSNVEPWFGEQPLEVEFTFVRARPGSHYGSGRNADVLKDRFRDHLPTGRPDALKLARAAEDALTGVVWRDDAQIVVETLRKVFSNQAGMPRGASGMLVKVRDACAPAIVAL